MLPRQSAALALLRRHPAVQRLARIAGPVPAHLVGGAVRDRMLGLPTHDLDAVVERRGREIAERLAAELPARLVLLGGKSFAAYRLVGEGLTLDLWDREGMTLDQDLARRDFTVNAMALTLAEGRLVDPFDGERDLALRVLRATTADSFRGDPLRVLRLARLAVQLPGFAVEPATLELARASAQGLDRVAAERVRDELGQLLARDDAHRGVAILGQLAVYPGLWQGHPGQRVDTAATCRAVLRLEALATSALLVRQAGGEVDLPAARAAVLLRGLGHPADEALRRLTGAGFVAQRQAAEIAPLLRSDEIPALELEQRVYLHGLGRRWGTAAAVTGAIEIAAGRGTAWERSVGALAVLLRRAGAALLDPPPLLDGDEVRALLGIEAGPEVGAALRCVREAQVAGRVRSREEARRLLLGED